ncbi:MAG: L-threonylcarbamoyladenylate synthase [Bacteroidales bacterium]
MDEDIKKACEVLNKGGVILYPTDTIWGIGCDATNAEAVKRVYEIKERADNKAMLVLLDSDANLSRYVADPPEIAYTLIEVSDKPLTIIYDNAYNLAKNLIGEDKSIGIRITSEDFSRQLCRRFRRPIVSTSANISGAASPSNFAEISEKIKSKVDYIVEHRQNEKGGAKASSIIKLGADGTIKIIRD